MSKICHFFSPDLFHISAFSCLHFQKKVFFLFFFLTLMIKKWQYDTRASFSWSERAKYILVVTACFKSPFSLSVELSVIIRVENNFESSSSGRGKKKGALVPQYGKTDRQSEKQKRCCFGNVSFYPVPTPFYKMHNHIVYIPSGSA